MQTGSDRWTNVLRGAGITRQQEALSRSTMSTTDPSHPLAPVLGGAVGGFVLASLIAVAASPGTTSRNGAIQPEPSHFIPVRVPDAVTRDLLDALRMEAAMGNSVAS